jgi:TolB-like protein
MSDVFISYARSTEKQALQVAEALRGQGYNIWRDDELPAHRAYTDVIEERLKAARAVVVIWSAEAAKSHWVRAEANTALEAGTLVQMTVDGVMPPMPFGQIQCADLSGWTGDTEASGWRKVVASVADLVGRAGSSQSRPTAASSGAKFAEPLLAVLAFDNLSGDPEMAFFSDGVSEEILDTVARGSDLKVIARSSSFQFRGADKAVRRVVADLRATHLLDGSVRRSGSRVRIAARLVDCASDTTVWSDRFDRELTDVFELQDEIAAAVAAALKSAFAPRVRAEPIDPAVYEQYLRAREVSTTQGPAGLGTAVALLREVTATAPNFAEGWAQLAVALTGVAWRGGAGEAFKRLRAEALAAAEASLRLDPANATAYAAQNMLEPDGAYEAHLAILRKTEQVAPNHPDTLWTAAYLAFRTGRVREAAEAARKASELDPLDSWPASLHADAMTAVDDEAARRLLLDGRSKWPANPGWSNALMAHAIFHRDWPAFADAEAFAKAHEHYANANVRGMRTYGRAVRDNDPAFADRLRRAVEEELARTGSVALNLVIALAVVGSVDEAFEVVERASYDEIFGDAGVAAGGVYSGGLIFITQSRALLAPDPRFMRLCGKLGLVDFWLKTGRWPDIADEVPYDFRAEAGRLAGATGTSA